MSRDYKNVPRKQGAEPGAAGGILPFVTGLVVGVFGAFIIFLNLSDSSYQLFKSREEAPPAATRQGGEPPGAGNAGEANENIPVPKFDFYNILPNKEINISEWVAEDQAMPAPASEETGGLYILQVGSFRQLDAADQVKAQLALLGISADIQRVVINGQDTRYRVRVGPYEDQKTLEAERARLRENNLDYMLLKLQAE